MFGHEAIESIEQGAYKRPAHGGGQPAQSNFAIGRANYVHAADYCAVRQDGVNLFFHRFQGNMEFFRVEAGCPNV